MMMMMRMKTRRIGPNVAVAWAEEGDGDDRYVISLWCPLCDTTVCIHYHVAYNQVIGVYKLCGV